MKNFILIIYLLMSTSAAHAEWVRVSESSDEGTVMYVDFSTIKKSGATSKLWVLLDYKKMQILNYPFYISSKSQFLYDCSNQMSKQIYNIFTDGNMGSGAVTNETSPNKWNPVPPGTFDELGWKIACGKLKRKDFD